MFLGYLILGLWVVGFELSRRRGRALSVDFLSLFHFYFFCFYLMPGFFLNLPYDWGRDFLDPVYGNIKVGSIDAIFAIYVGYLLIYFGYMAGGAKNFFTEIEVKRAGEGCLYTLLVTGCILIAVISIFVYASQYGGFFHALAYANVIRAGGMSPGPFSFFIRFLLFGSWGMYLGIAYLLFRKRFFYQKTYSLGLLLIAIGVVMINSVLLAGRAGILNVAVVLIIIFSIHRREYFWKMLGMATPFALLILFFGKDVFRALSELMVSWDYFVQGLQERASGEGNFLKTFVMYFEFGYVSLEVYLKEVIHSTHEWRWMIDWVYGATSLVPKILFPSAIGTDYNMAYINTENVVGVVNYEIPPGLLAASFYSMDWLGLVVCCLFYGFVGGVLDRMLRGILDQAYWTSVVYAMTGIMWGSFLTHGDPQNLFQGHFVSFVMIAFWMMYGIRMKKGGILKEILLRFPLWNSLYRMKKI